MCPYVHPCKSLKESRCLRKSKHARLQDNARHAKPEAVRLCCTQCSKTPVEKFCNETYHVQGHSVTQIMPFSFNLCCLSSGFSENEAAASYGLNRIKRIISSPSDVTCPLDSCVPMFIHASPRTNPVVCVRANMQDCKTMQDMPNPKAGRLCCTQCPKTPVEKFCNETYHVPGQGAPKKHGSTGLEAPDKINVSSSSVQWFFNPRSVL